MLPIESRRAFELDGQYAMYAPAVQRLDVVAVTHSIITQNDAALLATAFVARLKGAQSAIQLTANRTVPTGEHYIVMH